jgi:hypothetical protein
LKSGTQGWRGELWGLLKSIFKELFCELSLGSGEYLKHVGLEEWRRLI